MSPSVRVAAATVSACMLASILIAGPASAASNIFVTLHGGVSAQEGYEVWFNQSPTAEIAANSCATLWEKLGNGTPVKVKNERGKTVGSGSLSWRVTKIEDYHQLYADIPADAPTRFSAYCVLEAKIPVKAASSYTVQIVGAQKPGAKPAAKTWTFTDKQLAKKKGKVDLNWR